MDGGVAVPPPPMEGFFHMPKLQVPNYQKPRVFVPMHHQSMPPADPQDPDSRLRQPGHVYNATKFSGNLEGDFDGRRIRKTMVRKTVDYNSSVVKYLENRVWQRDGRDYRSIQPDGLYQYEMTPPINMQHKPMNCLTTKFMRQSTNKFRCPIFCISWTPEGRRLVTGASSGEFTLWNGLTFSFETILQAHETSVRAMVWSHNDQWMVTGDHAGFIKYWQTNMNNVKMYQGHKEPVRSISFCPTDAKFVTSSDDGTVRVWDFLRCYEEKILRGHGADVKCVDWHPYKSLVASGSKDNQVPIKLWDPKSGQSLATLHAHKFTVMSIKWNRNGNWLLTAARDHLMKLFDIRNLKEELQVFKGHKKEATAIAWHPINEEMFASGGSDGAVMFWEAGTEKEVGSMEEAHDAIIWDLAWHPLGHVLASASNDHSTKFWTRNRPGDAMRDKYNLNIAVLGPDGEPLDIDADVPLNVGENKSQLPGMGLEHGLPPEKEEKPPEPSQEEELPSIPGLDWSQDAEFFKDQHQRHEERPRKKLPYSRPIPRTFEQAWITNQQPTTVLKDPDVKPNRSKIQSLLTLELPQKPLKLQSDKGAGGLDDQDEDFNPFLDDVDDDTPGDQDYRGDEDFRQDEDMRGDQDFRADMDFRGADRGADRGGKFQGFGSQGAGGPPQGQNNGGQSSGRGTRGSQGGGRRGYRGDRSDSQGYDDLDQDQDYKTPGSRGGNRGDFDDDKMDFDGRDRSPGPRGRDRSPGPRGRGRRGQGHDGFRGRDRGNNRRNRGNWNDDNSQGDNSFNENDESKETRNSRDRSERSERRGGRGKFRGSDSYRGGNRGGRRGQKGNYRGGGDNRGSGRGRGRGNRGGN